MKSKIEHPFTGSRAELEQERDEHHSNLERNSRELKEVNVNINNWWINKLPVVHTVCGIRIVFFLTTM